MGDEVSQLSPWVQGWVVVGGEEGRETGWEMKGVSPWVFEGKGLEEGEMEGWRDFRRGVAFCGGCVLVMVYCWLYTSIVDWRRF